MCVCVCVCEQGYWREGLLFIGGSLNIFQLWSESQHASAQCHKGVFDGKEREKKKETSGFGSKHWISFQAWTLHWAFQQMSKSLLAVDRQPNGPQHWECGRAMGEEEEKEMETKDKHKGKNGICFFLFLFFFCIQGIRSWRSLKKCMSCQDTSHHLSLCGLAAPVVYFPFFHALLCCWDTGETSHE